MRKLLYQISGVLFFFFFLGLLFLNSEAGALLTIHFVFASLCLLGALYLGRGKVLFEIREAIQKRSFRNLTAIIIQTFLVFVIVVCLNYFAYRFNDRIDFTENKIHHLSLDSQRVLDRSVGSFSAVVALPAHSKMGMHAHTSLEKYREYLGADRFRYRFVSPTAQPAEIPQPWPTPARLA